MEGEVTPGAGKENVKWPPESPSFQDGKQSYRNVHFNPPVS